MNLNIGELEIDDISATILSSTNMQDYNSFTDTDKIQPQQFKEFYLNDGALTVKMPAGSVVMLNAKMK